ncbi:MAG TPA: hydroxymethylpyrimidine/phosphomethylpyrimidine kinase [Deltaproteobacteria bacterium]|nr:hydroxymethylpyrimidine/phosphomethylpyrimidine kinase [Deltaproteobacteria bacterium]
MQSALSIAGSDPTGGAGLQADLQVFHAFGVHGAAVPTALTIQDGLRVHRMLPVFPSVLLEQLRTTLDVIRPTAIKIGMLATDDSVRNVLLALAPIGGTRVVIDPVLAASDGTPLLERRAHGSLRNLCHRRCLLTPNWPEAEILVKGSLARRRDGERAARELLEDLELGAVLLKGGHLEGDADDLLVMRAAGTSGGDADAGITSEWLPGERLPGTPVHGTGCALSAAIAAGLALGRPLRQAILDARRYVRHAIGHARDLPNGARILAFG